MSTTFARYLEDQIKLNARYLKRERAKHNNEEPKINREPHYEEEEQEEKEDQVQHVEVRKVDPEKQPKKKARKEPTGPCFNESCAAPDQGPFKRVRHDGKLQPLCLSCWARKKAEAKKNKKEEKK